jgi:hypothetical protein
MNVPFLASFPWKIQINGSGHNVYEGDDIKQSSAAAGRRPPPKLVKATPEMFESILQHRKPHTATKEHPTRMKRRLETVPFPPHACDICGRRYMHRRSLNDHNKSHTEETKCSYCYKKFSKVANLRAHIAAQHPQVDTLNKKVDL